MNVRRSTAFLLAIAANAAFAQIDRAGNLLHEEDLGGSSAGVGIVYAAIVVGAIAVWLLAGYKRRQGNKTSDIETPHSSRTTWNWRLIISCFVAFWAWKIFFIWGYDKPKPPVDFSVGQVAPVAKNWDADAIAQPEPASPIQLLQPQPLPPIAPTVPLPPTQAEKDAALKQQQANRQSAADLDERAARAIADYPYLDTPEGAETLRKIIDYRDEQIRGGTYPAIALTRAVNKFAPGNDPRGLR